jgi:hypothetical protein
MGGLHRIIPSLLQGVYGQYIQTVLQGRNPVFFEMESGNRELAKSGLWPIWIAGKAFVGREKAVAGRG